MRKIHINPLVGIQLMQNKIPDKEIAKIWGLNQNTMGEVRKHFNLPSRREVQKQRREFIISHNKNVITKRKNNWKENSKILVSMWNKGDDVLTIGKTLSIGVPTVYQKLIRQKHKGVNVKYRRTWTKDRVLKTNT